MSAGMAYEAMNNAGAMDSRLIVILNDNDMSIAPPVGALSAYLARLVSGRPYRSLRQTVRQLAKRLPKFLNSARGRRNMRAAWSPAARCSRSSAFSMSARSTATISTISCRCCENVARRRRWPDPRPCRDPEGQRLRAGGSLERQISRRRQIRRRDRQAGQAEIECALLHESVRREPGQGSRQGRAIVAITAAMPSGTGARHFRQGLSGPHVRCRHRRAARGDLCRRARDRGLQAVLRDLFDISAARLRSGRSRRRDPASAGALRARSRRAGRRRRADACGLLRSRLSRLPAGIS